MRILIVVLSALIVQVWSRTIVANTTSGRLLGTEADGVASFKGVRFAQAPVGDRRWEPPSPFVSSDTHHATSWGSACVEQFAYPGQPFIEKLYGSPLTAENEDCLFLNVWAPTPMSGILKPVIVYIHGGAFTFGSAVTSTYDGTSFAENQDVVFVTFNYRLNVFGFPEAPDLLLSRNNLGFLDQELVLAWVQDNIAQFGGDKTKVTIMGQSAGSQSVSLAIARRNSTVTPPFRAGIMLSGAEVSRSPEPKFSKFDAFATAMGCTQSPGSLRLQCLRNVSASTIRNYTNGPVSGQFSTYVVDNVTAFDDPLQRIRTGQIAQVPILLGSTEDDGTIFAYNTSQSISEFLRDTLGEYPEFLPGLVRDLYPGLNDDLRVIYAMIRDFVFRCPTQLWADAFVLSGIRNVYRYSYGAIFSDLQPFPDLGAWHGSELPIAFGTYNTSTASTAEVELSRSFQTALADFAKNPVNLPPLLNWPPYEPGSLRVASNPTLAKIAYEGNVHPDDFIQLVQPISLDVPCLILWDHFLDYRPPTNTVGNSGGTSMVDNQVGAQDSAFGPSLRVQV